MNISVLPPLLALSLIICSAGATKATGWKNTFSEKDNAQTTSVPKGAAFAVELEGNPTTGYSWSTPAVTGNAVKLDGKVVYKPMAHAPGLVGSSGKFIAHFKAEDSGSSTIKMQYARPWEKQPPARTFTLTVTVTHK